MSWTSRLRSGPRQTVDAIFAAVIVALGLLSTTLVSDPEGLYRDPGPVAVAIVLAATVPYFVRSRAPVAVLACSAAAITVLMLLDYDAGGLPFVLLVGAYTVGVDRPARPGVAVVAFVGALELILLAADVDRFGTPELVTSMTSIGVAMLVGRAMQGRRRLIDALEHERELSAQRAAADERLRIARELHDVVAHSLGVIAVQAGVGVKVLDADPDAARRSLENIGQASRSSLSEIRRLLAVVREGEGSPSYSPTPGLADLGRLAGEVTGAGLPVEIRVDGDLGGVPPGVGLAAYRIIQEALTNALRHAGARRAVVTIDGSSGRLSIEVTDDGRGATTTASGGHGLVGMRERVALYGGSLDLGPAPGGGFRVAVGLPYEAEPVA